MPHGRESVAVVVKTIRNTGALDHTWSASGDRAEVLERSREWQDRVPGQGVGAAVPDLVDGLPAPPDAGPWLNAVGVTTGQFWVWVTSSDVLPEA